MVKIQVKDVEIIKSHPVVQHSYFTGTVIHLESGADLDKVMEHLVKTGRKPIVFIKQALPEFAPLITNDLAEGIISLTGGPTAHLANIAREANFPLHLLKLDEQ